MPVDSSKQKCSFLEVKMEEIFNFALTCGDEGSDQFVCVNTPTGIWTDPYRPLQ
jgi:hypothetical protein